MSTTIITPTSTSTVLPTSTSTTTTTTRVNSVPNPQYVKVEMPGEGYYNQPVGGDVRTEVRRYTRPLSITHTHAIASSQWYVYEARAVSALVSQFVTAPFHVVQTLAQVGSREGRKPYSKIIEDLYRKEGISAFFKGSLVGALRFAATAGLNYVIYNTVRKLLADKAGSLSLDNHEIANAVSIILSSILSYPLETIRTRLVLDFDNKKYNGAMDCLTNSVANEGWGSLFNGAIVSSVGNYAMIEIMERIWMPVRVGLTGTLVLPNLLDAVAQSLLAQTLYYPIDTVVKMLQAPSIYKSLHPDVEFTGPVDATTSTIAKHGFFGLWRGFTVAAAQTVPYVLVAALTYQGTWNLFEQLNFVAPVTLGSAATSEVVRQTRLERV